MKKRPTHLLVMMPVLVFTAEGDTANHAIIAESAD
jgi:hypothetical protein